MKYNCEYCNYGTDSANGNNQHCKTLKHIKNKEYFETKKITSNAMVTNNNNALLKCTRCSCLFMNSEIVQHTEKCLLLSLQEKRLIEITELNKELNKKLDDQNNKLDDQNKKLNDQNNKLEEAYKKLEEVYKGHYLEMKETTEKIQQILIENKIENKEDKEYFKDLVQKAGTVVTTVMGYLNKNCSNTSATKQLENYEMEETEDKTCDNLAFNEKNNTLVTYLVKHMTEKYIENDITKQTFWTTDVSRYNYIFRGVRNPDDEDNKSVWLYDKDGVKIGEIVVRPFLNYIGAIINKKLKNILPIDIRREPMYGDYLSQIYKKIELSILERSIVADMAPHFHFDKTLLSNNNKLEYEEKKSGDKTKVVKLTKHTVDDDEEVKVIKKVGNVKKTIKSKIARK
jgi:hypothetical protein